MHELKLTETEFRQMVHEVVKAAPKPADAEVWWQHFNTLKTFRDTNGHCRLPPQSPLYIWTNKQREQWKEGKLFQDQMAALKGLGIERNRSLWETDWPTRNWTKQEKQEHELHMLRREREIRKDQGRGKNSSWEIDAKQKEAELLEELQVAYNSGLIAPKKASRIGLKTKSSISP